MPQSVPNLFPPPPPTRPKPAPSQQSQQPSQSDGQSFEDALGRVKDRGAREADPADKQPAKAEQKKPAKRSKAEGDAEAPPKAGTKDPKAKQTPDSHDGQPQADDSGQQSAGDGQKQSKKQPPEKGASNADLTDAVAGASVVQAKVAPAKPTADPKPRRATDSASGSDKPVKSAKAAPQQPAVQELRADADQPDADPSNSSATQAQNADQKNADRDPSGNSTPESSEEVLGATKSPGAKPPLLAPKQDVRSAPESDADASAQQAVAAAAVVSQLASDLEESGDAGQDKSDPAGDMKAIAKTASAAGDGASAVSAPDQSRPKAPAGVFRLPASDAAPPAPPEAQFAEANHARIVGAIHGQLLPGGGTMHIRLDPPELGALNVRVEMRDGVMTAAFETTNDQATKLLSHSLGDLKSALEAQGVSVEKLHVRQSEHQQSSSGEDRRGERQQDSAAQREQQRRDLMRRMWRRLMKGQDPLDLVA